MKHLWTVLRSYFSRWQFWLVLLFWLMQVGAFAATGLRSHGGRRDLWPMLLMAVGYTGAAIAFQVKEQLGAYRAALVPGFRTPHLLAGLIWLTVIVLPFPALVYAGGGSALGILGVALPMAGLAFAGCCRGGWRAGVFGTSCIILFVPGVAAAVGALAAGQYPWAAVGLCLGALWFVADTVFFLATMDEETPGYDVQFRGNLRQLSGPQARRNMLTAMRRLEREHSLWLRLVDVQIPDVMPFVGNSRWQRIAHWRRAHANWWMLVLTPAIMWGVMVAVQYGMVHGRPNELSLVLHGTLWILVMMPSTVALNAWQVRGSMLARELTYPVRRQDFVVEQAISILLSQFMAWGVLAGMMALTLACFPGVAPWDDLLVAVCISGPWQLIAFALLARLGTLGSAIPMIVALVLATATGTGILMGCIFLNSPPVTAFVATTSAILGGASLVLAYRHWLRVDIA
jgi:hypothetical protein